MTQRGYAYLSRRPQLHERNRIRPLHHNARRAKTTINPVQIDTASRVVSNGIFRYTRNPMYVGLTAALTSWALWLAVPWTLLGPVVVALFTHRFQIIPEERVMSARFGREYDEYLRRVRRWI